MPSIADTRQELVQLVLPEHANVQGTLFGGRMMYWMVTAATLPALRLARGPVVLGSMDHLDFLAPVRVGDVVVLRAQVESVGRSSMEIAVDVEAENPSTGERRRATSAHLTMVAVDAEGRTRPVGVAITPANVEERAAAEAARARKIERDSRLAARQIDAARDPKAARPAGHDGAPRHAIEVPRLVFPEDAISGTTMFAGTLLLAIDEFASILAIRYARGPIVTASVDRLDFYSPIHVGDIVLYQASIDHIGRTSIDVGVRVLAEDPRAGTARHTCTAYLTSVHVDADGRPAPVTPWTPETPIEIRRWKEAKTRRAQRVTRQDRS